MSLYDIIQNILDVSKNHNLVREVGEGDIYNYLNSSEHQYPCVFLTVSSINDDLNLRNVNCTLFYVDRLTSDESNKILVQSLGLSVLSDIVERIAGDVDTVEYTTFTEKFTDLCGGVYASLSIGYPLDGACSNDFEVRELEVTENGVYDVLGYDRIVVSVEGSGNQEEIEELEQELEAKLEEINNLQIEVEEKTSQIQTLQAENESLNQQITQKDGEIENLNRIIEQKDIIIDSNDEVVAGLEAQINSVTTLSVTENGTYIPEEGTLGWNNVDVNISYKKPVFKIQSNNTFRTNETELPFDIDSFEVNNFSWMFAYCHNLTTIPQLDFTNGNNFSGAFSATSKLENIKLDGSINYDISFIPCTKLTYESIKSILTACSNTTNTFGKTVYFERTLTDQNGELADLVATCNSKGWTISGLTIN